MTYGCTRWDTATEAYCRKEGKAVRIDKLIKLGSSPVLRCPQCHSRVTFKHRTKKKKNTRPKFKQESYLSRCFRYRMNPCAFMRTNTHNPIGERSES